MIWLFFNSSEDFKDNNINYFTSHNPSTAILAIDSKTGKKCLFTIPFECGQYDNIKNISYNEKTFKKELLDYFSIKRVKKIGINKKTISLHWYEKIREILKLNDDKIVDINKKVSELRLIKNEIEINKITKACFYTDKVFSEIICLINKNKTLTEKDVYNYIYKRSFELNLELAFNPIVASSENASFPHHISTNQILKNFVVIDMGYKFEGYCSDMTRTIYIETNTKITDKERKLWQKVKEMHDYAIIKIKDALKNNEKLQFKDIDIIIRANLGDSFNHSLGHGVGIEIHEEPTLSSRSEDKIKEGIVFTIEPGVYKKNKYGIRHENLFTIKESNLVKLTKSSEDLIVINNNKK
jgi:Xaa-Pro aminopeptidase